MQTRQVSDGGERQQTAGGAMRFGLAAFKGEVTSIARRLLPSTQPEDPRGPLAIAGKQTVARCDRPRSAAC